MMSTTLMDFRSHPHPRSLARSARLHEVARDELLRRRERDRRVEWWARGGAGRRAATQVQAAPPGDCWRRLPSGHRVRRLV